MKRSGMLLLLLIATAARGEGEATKTLECLRANVPAKLRIQEVELVTRDAEGPVQTLKGRLYAMREADDSGRKLLRAMIRLSQPQNLAGASYLVRETEDYLRDGMYVYLPSVRRVRRVTGTFADGALLGTDFSYFDFKQLQNAFGDLNARRETPTTLERRTVEVLSFKPREGVESRYSGVRAWIDQESCVVLKAEFLEGQQVRKRLTAPVSALQRSGNYWYASRMTMEDLSKKSRTELRLVDAQANGALPGTYFEPNSFHLSQ